MAYWEPNFSIDLNGPLSTLVRGLGVENGNLDDLNAFHFDDENKTKAAVNKLLNWYEDNLLFAEINENFRTAFVELSLNGLNQWQWKEDGEAGTSRALSIVENTMLLLVLSPDFMVDAGNVPDLTPPTIELLGASEIDLPYGTLFVEPGFQTMDNVYYGSMNSKVMIQGDVNSSAAGTYVISYSVVDAAGNISETVERTVTVSENPKQTDKIPPEISLSRQL